MSEERKAPHLKNGEYAVMKRLGHKVVYYKGTHHGSFSDHAYLNIPNTVPPYVWFFGSRICLQLSRSDPGLVPPESPSRFSGTPRSSSLLMLNQSPPFSHAKRSPMLGMKNRRAGKSPHEEGSFL